MIAKTVLDRTNRANLSVFAKHLWPADRFDLKIRTVTAVSFLLAAKVVSCDESLMGAFFSFSFSIGDQRLCALLFQVSNRHAEYYAARDGNSGSIGTIAGLRSNAFGYGLFQ